MLPGCLWKWHRIEKGQALTEDEIGFVVELVMGLKMSPSPMRGLLIFIVQKKKPIRK
jgi:hypothetical protein